MNTKLWELYNTILAGYHANGTNLKSTTLAKKAFEDAQDALAIWESQYPPEGESGQETAPVASSEQSGTSVTIKTVYGETTIHSRQDGLTMEDMITELINPALIGTGYSTELVAEYMLLP